MLRQSDTKQKRPCKPGINPNPPRLKKKNPKQTKKALSITSDLLFTRKKREVDI